MTDVDVDTDEPDAEPAEDPSLLELLRSLGDGRRYDPMPWKTRAACKGEEHLFFSPPGERPETATVREMSALYYCSICPVKKPCRQYARRNREYGVWGGETEEDRAWAGHGPDMPIGNVARVVSAVGRRKR